MDSPPKRRKTSETTGVAVGASQPLAPRDGTRSSGRPPFQSPTRSSLAKSHPDVLERALSRSPSRRPTSRGSQSGRSEHLNARTVGLRDRKALRPSLNPTSSPFKVPRMSGEAPMLSPSRRSSGIQAFSKPPRRLSKKIVPADFTFGSPIGKQIQPTEQDLSNTPEDQLALELGSATKEAEMEAAMDTGMDSPLMDEDPLEPDLPPTPTQLGLEKVPDRPRGLLSSSPSTRHEKRMKRRPADVLQGSPLKSLRFQPPGEEEGSDNADLLQDELSAAVLEKRKSRKGLAAELKRLKDDVAEMTKWTEKIESDASLGANTNELNKFLSLLTEASSYINRPAPQPVPTPISSLLSSLLPFSVNIPRPTREASPLPTNPFALKEISQSPSYLTVFAPLALHANTSRTSSPRTTTLLETHTLTFTAPPPFPASRYNVSVVYETNPETQSLISLSVPTGSDSKKQRVPETLRWWIDARLANPLLKLDVATLCWGINRYWEASVARAQLWARIEHKHGNGASSRKDTLPEAPGGAIALSELRRLVPHLERSAMVVKSRSSDNSPRVLLSNVLTMDDWTGEPQLRPELSVSTLNADGGSSKRIDHEARKLFHALLREEGPATTQGVTGGAQTDAILQATEGALGALFGSD